MTSLATPQAYEVAMNLKTLCDDAHGTLEIVAERVDDHFLTAELVEFAAQFRQVSIDLRKALFRLDAPEELRSETPPAPRQWDTALTNRDRFAMLLACETKVKAMTEALRSALPANLPQALGEAVELHYLEVKQMQRQLRVMREMVNPY